MIATIGSLVQETSHRLRWILASSLYTAACASTSLLLGVVLSELGKGTRQVVCAAAGSCVQPSAWMAGGAALVGVLAFAYAAADTGLIHLPRPYLMAAVPVTWWRRWRPYGGALAYGAALGLGFTTRIQLGAFYVICAWCVVRADVGYGALIMGTYGVARALTMFPVSWGVYRDDGTSERRIDGLLARIWQARAVVAVILAAFGTQAILYAVH